MTTALIADDHPLLREALRGAVLRALPDATLREADSVAALLTLMESEGAHDRGVAQAGRQQPQPKRC